MKIYTEVTMEWDEDSQKVIEISSESYEYNGEVALCKRSAPKWHLQGEKGQPAWQAMGMIDKPFGQSQKFAYPSEIPSVYDQSMPVGGEYIGGEPISQGGLEGGGATLGPFNVRSALSNVGSPATQLMKNYGERFGPEWYSPLIESAVTDPIRQTLRGEMTTPEARFGNILPQNILSEGKAEMGGTSWAQPGQHLVAGGETGTPSDLTSDLSYGEENYLWKAGNIAAQRADIQTDRGLLSQDIGRREDKYSEDTIEAERMRQRERADLARTTTGLTENQVAQVQKYSAPAGKSGFAYSGPAQQYAETGAREQERKLRDVGVEKRRGESSYQKAIDEMEESYDEDIRGYDERGRGFDRAEQALDTQLSQAQKDWREDKIDYAKGIKGLAQSASDDLAGLQSWITGVRPRHAQFGRMLGEQMRSPGIAELKALSPTGSKRNIRRWDKADIFGKTTYDAPAGGWFRESGPLPGEGEGVGDIAKADAFADYLEGLGYEGIAEEAFGTDWETAVPELPGTEG